MTAGWLSAILIAIVLAGLAALIARLPPAFVNGFRLFIGFSLLTILAWIIRRMLAYESFLMMHRRDILAIFDRDDKKRSAQYDELIKRTDELAARLRIEEGRA